MRMRIEMYLDTRGAWRWRAVEEGTNRIIADGAEGYVGRANLEQAVDDVMIAFRGHVLVTARERRGSEPKERSILFETITVAEYLAEGDTSHESTQTRSANAEPEPAAGG